VVSLTVPQFVRLAEEVAHHAEEQHKALSGRGEGLRTPRPASNRPTGTTVNRREHKPKTLEEAIDVLSKLGF